MISADHDPRRNLVSNLFLSAVHSPLLHTTPDSTDDTSTKSSQALSPTTALHVLHVFLSNTDPPPTLLSALLSPIVSALYGLLSALDCVKTADPAPAETARGLLVT